MQNQKLLILSELGNTVSYSYVIKDLKNIFESRFNCYYFCIRNLGNDRCRRRLKEEGFNMEQVYFIDENLFFDHQGKLIENDKYTDNCQNGIMQLKEIISKVNPNIIMSLGDTELLKHQGLTIQNIEDFNGLFIPYIPLDVDNADEKWFEYNKDYILTVSEHSKKQFESISKDISVECLPHIIDENHYRILTDEEKQSVRKKMVGEEFKDSFIVGSINCNSFRKKWDVLIHSFCIFAQKVENSILVIKTHVKNEVKDSVYGGYDIIKLIKEFCSVYNIEPKRIRIIDSFLSRRDLNNLYNIFDVFLSTTSGEGWGLTTIEAAITKTPLVIPKCTTFPEIFGEDYGGYFSSKDYPINIARSHSYIDTTLDIIHNLFNCLSIGHKNYELLNIEYTSNLLPISSGLPTFLISKNNNNIKDLNILKKFESYKDCISFIKQSKINIYQIIISIDFKLLNETLKFINTSNYFNEKHDYKIIHLNKDIIQRSCCINSNPTCKTANANDISDKLIEFLDIDKRKECSEYVFNRVKGTYTSEKIKEKFNIIMDKWFKKI